MEHVFSKFQTWRYLIVMKLLRFIQKLILYTVKIKVYGSSFNYNTAFYVYLIDCKCNSGYQTGRLPAVHVCKQVNKV